MGRRALTIILAALLTPLATLAQATVGLTGNFNDISGGVTPGLQVQFLLAGCGGNLPRVVGHFGLIQTQYNFTPDPTTGALIAQIWPNDVITCGQTTGSTQYLVTFLVNNIPQGPATCFQITSSENPFDLNSQTPCNVYSVPPPPTPPFDGVFHNLNLTGLLSGTNAQFTGNVQTASVTLTTAPTPCTTGNYSTGFDDHLSILCQPLPTISYPVTTVFGRAGAVAAASGDYSCAQVTGAICSLPTLHYQTVQLGGTSQTQRSKLNLIQGTGGITITVADNPGADSTDYTISGSGDSATTCISSGCYFTKADGTLVEWGTVAGCTTSGAACAASVLFPHAFTSTVDLIPVLSCVNGPANCSAAAASLGTTGFTAELTAVVRVGGSGGELDSTESVLWHAIGH